MNHQALKSVNLCDLPVNERKQKDKERYSKRYGNCTFHMCTE